MADWIECRVFGDKDRVIYVNLDRVVAISEVKGGSMLTFDSGDQGSLAIGDTPSEILSKPKFTR